MLQSKSIQRNVISQKNNSFPLPKYSFGETLANSITHGIGIIFSLFATVLLISRTTASFTLNTISISTYCISLFVLYLCSTIYHAVKSNKAKKIFRIFDHCSIFLLIAGTYTPFSLIILKGSTGIIICSIVWAISILGIVLNLIDMRKYSIFSMICYLSTGWCILLAFKQLYNGISYSGFCLLLLGGLAYSFGAVLYCIGSKIPYIHSLWHIFVLVGSILHFFTIYLYVI